MHICQTYWPNSCPEGSHNQMIVAIPTYRETQFREMLQVLSMEFQEVAEWVREKKRESSSTDIGDNYYAFVVGYFKYTATDILKALP